MTDLAFKWKWPNKPKRWAMISGGGPSGIGRCSGSQGRGPQVAKCSFPFEKKKKQNQKPLLCFLFLWSSWLHTQWRLRRRSPSCGCMPPMVAGARPWAPQLVLGLFPSGLWIHPSREMLYRSLTSNNCSFLLRTLLLILPWTPWFSL